MQNAPRQYTALAAIRDIARLFLVRLRCAGCTNCLKRVLRVILTGSNAGIQLKGAWLDRSASSSGYSSLVGFPRSDHAVTDKLPLFYFVYLQIRYWVKLSASSNRYYICRKCRMGKPLPLGVIYSSLCARRPKNPPKLGAPKDDNSSVSGMHSSHKDESTK
jgi:hypothetical protein